MLHLILSFSLLPLWNTSLSKKPVYSYPAIWEGKLVITTVGNINLVESRRGKILWERRFLGTCLMGAGVKGNLVVVPTFQGYMHVFDIGSRGKRWSRKLDYSFLAPPVILKDSILQGTGEGYLLRIGLRRGIVLWKVPLKGPIYSPPAVIDGEIFAGDIRGHFFKISREGRLLCKKALAGAGSSQPVEFKENIVYASGKNLFLISKRDCAILKRLRFAASIIPPPVIVKNSIIVCAGRKIFLINKGERLWERKLQARVVARPLVAEGKIFVVDSSGNLYVLNLPSGKEILELKLGSPSYSPPLLDNNILIILDTEGRIRAYRVVK